MMSFDKYLSNKTYVSIISLNKYNFVIIYLVRLLAKQRHSVQLWLRQEKYVTSNDFHTF